MDQQNNQQQPAYTQMSTKRVVGISAATTVAVMILGSLARRAYNALTGTKVIQDTTIHKESGPAA